VAVVFFGEGAASIGDCHEAMALSALWKLPIIFVCENNQYSMGTPLTRTLAVEDVTARAAGYGMNADRFLCENVFQVKEHFAEAAARAREKSEPTLMEIRTYRHRGHSMSDPGKYRTSEEVEEYKRRDPLLRSRAELEKAGLGDALQSIDEAVEAEIADCVKFAEESPEPGPELLAETTYKGAFAR
jgi:pyruvate dehydrogenase E1 component alpha subunit